MRWRGTVTGAANPRPGTGSIRRPASPSSPTRRTRDPGSSRTSARIVPPPGRGATPWCPAFSTSGWRRNGGTGSGGAAGGVEAPTRSLDPNRTASSARQFPVHSRPTPSETSSWVASPRVYRRRGPDRSNATSAARRSYRTGTASEWARGRARCSHRSRSRGSPGRRAGAEGARRAGDRSVGSDAARQIPSAGRIPERPGEAPAGAFARPDRGLDDVEGRPGEGVPRGERRGGRSEPGRGRPGH